MCIYISAPKDPFSFSLSLSLSLSLNRQRKQSLGEKMADCSHLERMGRELKCPICLSLLNSSVSLSCNHVFCSSCIQKSMKSASSCPVCKVPYRRREVRPAPHMDNLVNIYKNMEVASGVNMFVTQSKFSEALPESSDEDKQVESAKSDSQEKNKRKNKQSKSSKVTHESGDQGKPSFPTKKRIQVPKYPPSHEQDRQEDFSCGLESIAFKEMPVANANKPGFTPFFWLRDEDDVEKLSQQTDPGQTNDTPPNAPCFSDIKDSGDEMPAKNSPNGGKVVTSKNVDCYDSEMFEWTQRPCSPELCTSPMKTQVEDTEEYNEIPNKQTIEVSKGAPTIGNKEKNENNVNVVLEQWADDVDVSLVDLPTQGTRKGSTENCKVKMPKKNGKKVGVIKKPRVGKTKVEAVEAQVDSEIKAESSIPKEHEAKFKSLSSDRPTSMRIKKVMFENSAVKQVPNNILGLSTKKGDMVLNNSVTDKPVSSNQIAQIASKSKNNTQKRKDCSNSLKVQTQSKSKCAREPRQLKKQKTSTDVLPNDKNPVVYDVSNEVSLKDTQPSRDFTNDCKVKNQLPTSTQGVLRKCDRVPIKVKCAFCHSTEDSEASGVMVHYFNGKPVSADHNGGSKLKHVHRNCTEWAPNVYFEDDNAINLEAELTRSKRIKCCCCDLKGAALGCYETSCRKSFHVPCAKLVPECRWDSDNFVMLCPLHASSKLPNEISGCEIKRKRSIVKRAPQSHKHEKADKDTSNMQRNWSTHRSPGNLVLCCSALTNEEKDIVSKFKKLSGVTVLKNWDSRVTHVIASTDENGACRRTLKFLMGIIEGKWILSTEWIKACMVAMEPVNEKLYEVGVDIHGVREGPRLGRLRVLNKQPKLFNGFKFYLIGDFVLSYKGYLHDLVVAAGGTVLQRKPISTDQISPSCGKHTSTFIIYSIELPEKSDSKKGNVILDRRRSEAEALASSSGAIVANNSWVLNSIAACKLQSFEEK